MLQPCPVNIWFPATPFDKFIELLAAVCTDNSEAAIRLVLLLTSTSAVKATANIASVQGPVKPAVACEASQARGHVALGVDIEKRQLPGGYILNRVLHQLQDCQDRQAWVPPHAQAAFGEVNTLRMHLSTINARRDVQVAHG